MRLRHHCCQLRKKEANAECGKTFQLIWSYNSSTWRFPFLQTPSVMLSFGFCGSAQSGTLWLNDCNLETLQIKEQGLKCSNCASSLPTQSLRDRLVRHRHRFFSSYTGSSATVPSRFINIFLFHLFFFYFFCLCSMQPQTSQTFFLWSKMFQQLNLFLCCRVAGKKAVSIAFYLIWQLFANTFFLHISRIFMIWTFSFFRHF